MPSGPVNVDANSKVVLPNQMSVYRSIEGLIHHFELIMTNRQWKSPVEECYAAIESPRQERLVVAHVYWSSGGTGGRSDAGNQLVCVPLRRRNGNFTVAMTPSSIFCASAITRSDVIDS